MVHAFRLFNYQATWDSLYNYYGVGATLTNGRWFLGYLGQISSNYDLAVVNGGLAILALAVVAVLLVDLFDITNRVFITVLSVLLVGFPTVVSSFTYMYTADCYMISFMLAVLAIYCGNRWKWGFLLGAVCICFSVGIYQANVATAMVMCVLVVIDRILYRDIDLKKLAGLCLRLILTLGVGMVFYEIMLKICLHGMSLIGYMGIDTVGILTFREYLDSVNVTWTDLKTFFNLKSSYPWMEGETVVSHYWNALYGRLNGILLVLTVVLAVAQCIRSRLYKKPLQLLVVCAGIIIMPFACLAINFATTVRGYHTLMMMALFLLYFFGLLMVYRCFCLSRRWNWKKIVSGAGAVAISVIAYMNALNANIGYYRQQLAWEKSYAISSNIMDRIQDMPEFGPSFSVLLVGEYNSYVFLDTTLPLMVGVTEESVLNDAYHYVNIWHQFEGSYLGTTASYSEAVNELRQNEEFQAMPCYPAKGSVKYINGVFAVKLSE
jgi:hypothetical protein